MVVAVGSADTATSCCGCSTPSAVLCAVPLLWPQVMQLHLSGSWSAAQIRQGLELGMGACQQLHGLMRTTLLEAAVPTAADDDGGGDADDMQQ